MIHGSDLWAQVVDGVSFGFINLLQARGRAGACSAAELSAYAERWATASLEDYYAVPAGASLELTEPGTLARPSAWPSGCPANDRTHLEIRLGPRGWESPTMLLLHGFMSVSDTGYRRWAGVLNEFGWSAIFFHLPYHYGRCPVGSVSGEMALTSNLIRSAEGIRQAVIELRVVCRRLVELGSPRLGVWAMSYGGWVGALLCLLEERLTTAWLLEPITDVDHVVWSSPASVVVRRQLRRRGIGPEQLTPLLRLVCPSYHQPITPSERILLLAGTFDRIAPPEVIRRLHERWQGSHYAEFRQGHIGYQLMPASLQMARERMPDLFE